MGIQFKEIDEEEIQRVVSFHNKWYDDNRTPDQWLWEYKGMYPDSFVFTIIKDDNKIIGTQGMIPISINIGGEKYLSGKSENSLLDPKYRGGTLFKELYEFAVSLCKKRGMCCIWGLTSVAKVWRDKLGFHVYDNAMYNTILILKPIKFIKTFYPKKLVSFAAVLALYTYSALLRFLHINLRDSKTGIVLKKQLASVDDISKLYERLRKKYPDIIHIIQDQKYISWRIFNNPNVNYITFSAYENNILKGYCYVALTSRKEAYLSDLTFETVKIGESMLKFILREIQKQALCVYFFGNIKNPLIRRTFNLLKKYGFMKIRSTSFVIKNLSYENEEYLYDIRNWYINGLWTEGYRF